jgi:hypothetical protein
MRMPWQKQLKGDSLSWLLEPDPVNPGVRYFALKDLLGKSEHDPEVVFARDEVMNSGPVPIILASQHTDGYWFKPGPGYSPRHRGTTWRLIQLALLGADGSDPCIQQACDYVLDHSRSDSGGFSYDGSRPGMVQCLQGNLVAALIELGCYQDERLQTALSWLARSITGEGIAAYTDKDSSVRYYQSGNSAPGFVCAYNNQLPCAWGAVKSMWALSNVPQIDRDEVIESAIRSGLEFLLSSDPAKAEYPMGYSQKPNNAWFKFGMPVGYSCDILQALEVLSALGMAKEPRLRPAIELLLKKQDENGRWKMENSYKWVDIETKGEPSKWVTLRALRVISQVF